MKRISIERIGIMAAMCVAMLSVSAAPLPAAADGAASTRNIIFGAAAVGGTLLILNHNKKVHQKYAEYDQRQAQTQSAANQAQAAYESERAAYAHEASLVSEFQKETQYQHAQIKQRDREISGLKHALVVAKSVPGTRNGSFVRTASVPSPQSNARPVQVATYGWGQF